MAKLKLDSITYAAGAVETIFKNCQRPENAERSRVMLFEPVMTIEAEASGVLGLR